MTSQGSENSASISSGLELKQSAECRKASEGSPF